MMFDISYINAPPLVPETTFVGHLFTRLRGLLLLFSGQTIQATIEGQESATGSLREVNAELFEPGAHAIFPQVRGRDSYASDLGDGFKRDLARRVAWCS
jgi:hypothetical protein